jgi:hypothetical protein
MKPSVIANAMNSLVYNDQFEVPDLKALKEITAEQVDILILATIKGLQAVFDESKTITASLLAGNIAQNLTKMIELEENFSPEQYGKLGSFCLFCAEMVGLFYTAFDGDSDALIEGIDEAGIRELSLTLDNTSVAVKPLLQPSKVTPNSILKFNKGKSLSLSKSNQPILYEVLNRKHSLAWAINVPLLVIAKRHHLADTKVFLDYYFAESYKASRSKRRLAETILDTASELLDTCFYHNYFLDFRSRIYPYTAFLTEQSTDMAKGLLILHNGKELGKDGYDWIKHGLATHWAGDSGNGIKTDKLNLRDRVHWVDRNIDLIRSYARDPDINVGWMNADEPWQFLSKCIELDHIEHWKAAGFSESKFVSNVVCYVDGTNNGSQHLAALTRDTTTAKLVNLTDNDKVQDLYLFVANYVWETIDKEALLVDQVAAEEFLSKLKEIREKISIADSDFKAKCYEELKALKDGKLDEIKALAPYYWSKVKVSSERRKLAKRNVMTMSYGLTKFGAGEQIMDDAYKHDMDILNYLERSWGRYLGALIYDTMFICLPDSTSLLNVFKEAGRRQGSLGKSLTWRTPFINFPVVQDYTKGTPVYVKTRYNDHVLKVTVINEKVREESMSKQATGTAPNMVHSLDATHLMLTIYNCSEDVVTIHDSFGGLAGGMTELSRSIRESFVQLYQENPLPDLLEQIGVPDLEVHYGDFDVREVLRSQFCFI